jgi:hypothetical protein
LNQSPFPPEGGGIKMIIIPTLLSWGVIYGIVLMSRKASRPMEFRLGSGRESADE